MSAFSHPARLLRSVPAFLLAVVVAVTALPVQPAAGQGPEQFRDISGKVVDANHQPVKGAVVKLEDEGSEAIQSYLTDADGYFHFKHISMNDDVKVWTTLHGATSKKVELSKFNSKPAPFITLTLP